jgi:hypothetical protein
MDKLSRRKFFVQTSVGVGTVSALTASLTAVPHLAAVAALSHDESATTNSAGATNEPVVLYVRDYARNEVGLLVGQKEVIFHDSALVARIVRAAH